MFYIGINLSKSGFAPHCFGEGSRPPSSALVRPSILRDKLLPLVAKLPPCGMGMEACWCTYHWTRPFVKFGYTVKLLTSSS